MFVLILWPSEPWANKKPTTVSSRGFLSKSFSYARQAPTASSTTTTLTST